MSQLIEKVRELQQLQMEQTMLLREVLDGLAGGVAETVDPEVREQVATMGESAYRHQQYLLEHGTMTLRDSLAIRRELYGDKVRSTANQFSSPTRRSILLRKATGKVDYDHEVILTDRGEWIAQLWAREQGLAD
jgi:hypothetical protein